MTQQPGDESAPQRSRFTEFGTPWRTRVDGHTAARPMQGGRFRSNWELSASRAIAVVQYLISKGIAPQRLVAAGFGEFQPIYQGEGPEALARNRRIELRLTDR